MVEVSLTVGKLDASLALLLTKDHHLIEFPTILLPDGVNAGSVITIKCEQDLKKEEIERKQFESFQEEILELYGTNEPKPPVLKVKNVTQTSAVLEWNQLDLGSSSIKSLTLYKNGSRLGQIPNPLVVKTTKLSGLPIDNSYEFYLKLDTTAGVYQSEKVNIRTHKMTNLSGITVCLGEVEAKENITSEDISKSLESMGAKPLQEEITVDTTHFVASLGLGPQWQKAVDSNIPVVRPEWLKACETERRIVPARDFYLDAEPEKLVKYRYHTSASNPTPNLIQGSASDAADELKETSIDKPTEDPKEVKDEPVAASEHEQEQEVKKVNSYKSKEVKDEPVAASEHEQEQEVKKVNSDKSKEVKDEPVAASEHEQEQEVKKVNSDKSKEVKDEPVAASEHEQEQEVKKVNFDKSKEEEAQVQEGPTVHEVSNEPTILKFPVEETKLPEQKTPVDIEEEKKTPPIDDKSAAEAEEEKNSILVIKEKKVPAEAPITEEFDDVDINADEGPEETGNNKEKSSEAETKAKAPVTIKSKSKKKKNKKKN